MRSENHQPEFAAYGRQVLPTSTQIEH